MATRTVLKSAVSLALGNFFGGLGSGAVVAKGLTPANFPANTDSILAYLIGSALSLAAILGARRRIGEVGKYLSLANVLCVLVMVAFFTHQASWTPWVFFALFSLHFALVFVPRTFRTDLASVENSSVSLVELGYALGTAFGLTLWEQLEAWSFVYALGFAGVCYALAFVCDSRHSAIVQEAPAEEPAAAVAQTRPNHPLLPFAILVVVVLTIGVQITVQMISKNQGTSLPLAAFEIGVTLAPLALLFLRASLGTSRGTLGASTCDLGRLGVSTPLYVPIAGAMLFIALGILVPGWVPVCVFVAAYLYESLALILFGWMGKEAAPGNVALTFGIMAVTAMGLYGAFLYWGSGVEFIVGTFVVAALTAGGAIFCRPELLGWITPKRGRRSVGQIR